MVQLGDVQWLVSFGELLHCFAAYNLDLGAGGSSVCACVLGCAVFDYPECLPSLTWCSLPHGHLASLVGIHWLHWLDLYSLRRHPISAGAGVLLPCEPLSDLFQSRPFLACYPQQSQSGSRHRGVGVRGSLRVLVLVLHELGASMADPVGVPPSCSLPALRSCLCLSLFILGL